MNSKFIRKGIIVTALAGVLLIPFQKNAAAEETELLGIAKQEKTTQIDENCLVNAVAEIQKQENTDKTIKIESSEEIKLNNLLNGKVFVKTEEGYSLVYVYPNENRDWSGKAYDISVVKITQRGDIWSQISTGNVLGYVRSENLITGKDAVAYAKSILADQYPEKDVLTLTQEEVEAAFSAGETKEEEATRLAAEEAARIATIKEVSRKKGVELVNYAKRFIGNPYVYGGTSLTRGTDCSGFVHSVYKHFGVSLPRTSYSMRKVGYKVSYSEIQPGDIVCYSGHVGIYAGNGKIVNAIDEA